jgi:phosphopantothenoylcysteine decarboxylase/phosphopantothenate--cysteine ligase
MAQLVVRNPEEEVKARLRDRAARNGRSMEEEIREILRDAANAGDAHSGGWAAKSSPGSPGRD